MIVVTWSSNVGNVAVWISKEQYREKFKGHHWNDVIRAVSFLIM